MNNFCVKNNNSINEYESNKALRDQLFRDQAIPLNPTLMEKIKLLIKRTFN